MLKRRPGARGRFGAVCVWLRPARRFSFGGQVFLFFHAPFSSRPRGPSATRATAYGELQAACEGGAGKRLLVGGGLPRTPARISCSSGASPATQRAGDQAPCSLASQQQRASWTTCTQPTRAAARSGASTPAARCGAKSRKKEAASVLKRRPGARGRFGAVCVWLRPARRLRGGYLRQAARCRFG